MPIPRVDSAGRSGRWAAWLECKNKLIHEAQNEQIMSSRPNNSACHSAISWRLDLHA